MDVQRKQIYFTSTPESVLLPILSNTKQPTSMAADYNSQNSVAYQHGRRSRQDTVYKDTHSTTTLWSICLVSCSVIVSLIMIVLLWIMSLPFARFTLSAHRLTSACILTLILYQVFVSVSVAWHYTRGGRNVLLLASCIFTRNEVENTFIPTTWFVFG